MTHIRGIGSVGEPLIFSMAAKNSQVNLLEYPLPFDPSAGWFRGVAAIRNLLAEATESDKTFTYIIDGEAYGTKGLPILPPPLHDQYYPQDRGVPTWEYRRTNYTPPGYSPLSDGPLNTYLNIMELLIQHLGIGQRGDVEEDAAITALLNPKIARLAWPCADEIQTFEESILMPLVNKRVVELSRVDAIESLRRPSGQTTVPGELPGLGLTHTEAFDLVETAITYSGKAFAFDPTRERSTMINKIHSLATRCGDAGMVTTELNSLKTISQILGLTRQEEDSNMDKREVLSSALEAEIIEKKTLPVPADSK